MTDAETLAAAADVLEGRASGNEIADALRRCAATEPTELDDQLSIRYGVTLARGVLRQAAGVGS